MNTPRRPFWLPASNYYVLAVAVALAFFFVTWGILDDIDGMRTPWQTAGVGASFLLVGAVIFREFILRRRTAAVLRQPSPRRSERQKLSIERTAAILSEITRKSEAANILDRVASGHREVLELCSAFMQRIDAELPSVQPGSPRLAALLRSRTTASDLHRFHTLRWAEIEARALSADAHNLPEPDQRIRAAASAVAIVDEALVSYPGEQSLLDSRALLDELAVSIRVANAVESAERAADRGDMRGARSHYRDALLHLGHGNVDSPERRRAALRIRQAVEHLPFSPE